MNTNRIFLRCAQLFALVLTAFVSPLTVLADLAQYDAAIAEDHGDGGGALPYAATLTEPQTYDATGGTEFDFGEITDSATFEFILEGDPDGARNGYLAVGENTASNLRYEQWDDTGQLGFTRLGLADYLFNPEGDNPDLINSPRVPTHVTYAWNAEIERMSLFIDGLLAGTVDGSFEMPTGAGFLGANPGGAESMSGIIHRVTTYDALLDAETIRNHASAWLAAPPPPKGTLAQYDAAINADHGDGDGPLPYAASLTEPQSFDTTGGAEFNFGEITDSATFEFILEGDPDAARNGYLAVGENTASNLRYEQWDDTSQLGFTRLGLADYLFNPEGDNPDLIASPRERTHVTYAWNSEIERMSLFIDGLLAGTVDGSFEMPTGAGFLGSNPSGAESMSGTIHRVTTYNALLSAEAIRSHASAWLAPVKGDLTQYDAAIAADHGDGAGSQPYASTLTEPQTYDTTGGSEFNFGEITDSATFEFILEGDPDAARNGYLAVGENTASNLRYEQWDDTGQLGFTRLGLADYLFNAEGDNPDLIASPRERTHVTYAWNADIERMSLFIDGVLAGTVDGSFEMPTGAGFLGSNPSGAESMSGTIYRVTTYNDLLSPETIQSHASAWLGGPDIDVIVLERSLTEITFLITGPGAAGLDESTIKLSIDGVVGESVITKGDTNVTISYTPDVPFEPSSAQPFTFNATDGTGTDIELSDSFTLPTPAMPLEGVNGPEGGEGFWGLRQIYGMDRERLRNLPEALEVVANPDAFGATVSDTTSQVIDFELGDFNFGGPLGIIDESLPFPVIEEDGVEDLGNAFVIVAKASFFVVESGEYTIGAHTNDGFGMLLNGAEFASEVGDGSIDRLHPSILAFTGNTVNSDTRAVVSLVAGTVYGIQIVGFQDEHDTGFEFYAAKGAFEQDEDTDQWFAIGDPSGPIQLVGSNQQSIEITEVVRSSTDVTVTWASGEDDGFFLVQRSSNLIDWTEVATGIASEAEQTSFMIENATGPEEYYRVGRSKAPPLLSESFESGATGWSVVDGGGSTWELGTPTAGPAGAYGGDNAYGTDLDGPYANGTVVSLRSPVIDLTEATRPLLKFWYYIDSEFEVDGGQLNFLDENGELIVSNEELFWGTSDDWVKFSQRIPTAARGQKIILEFRFLSNEGGTNGQGWFIDEVTIE
ncbi:MAG: hypothetical protein L7V86_00075 [Verrucomicrobiales bacterium]|nr:hypothetical protein [Verrucomicrobiales bacterium]